MRLLRSLISSGSAIGCAGYLLVRFAPAPAELIQHLRSPHDWVARVGTDAAVATLAGVLLWLCALWVLVGLAAVWIGQLPGLAGQLGRTVAHCAVPVAIQRLVAASAGFSLLLGGASAGAIGQSTGSPSIPANAKTAPGWPVDQPIRSAQMAEPTSRPSPSRPTEHPPPIHTVAGGWPLDSASASDSDSASDSASASGSGSDSDSRAARSSRPAPTRFAASVPTSKAPPTVTVRPGDSLWTIAGAELGPAATDQQIAIAWPYWYRANRPLIGRDPGLLRPGTRLNRPAAERSGQSQPTREGRP